MVKHIREGHIDIELDTLVFACANDKKVIPAEVLSRFEVVQFPPYTRVEFINICISILSRREGKDPKTALYIAKEVWDVLRVKDVREAVRVAQVCYSKSAVRMALPVSLATRPTLVTPSLRCSLTASDPSSLRT